MRKTTWCLKTDITKTNKQNENKSIEVTTDNVQLEYFNVRKLIDAIKLKKEASQ